MSKIKFLFLTITLLIINIGTAVALECSFYYNDKVAFTLIYDEDGKLSSNNEWQDCDGEKCKIKDFTTVSQATAGYSNVHYYHFEQILDKKLDDPKQCQKFYSCVSANGHSSHYTVFMDDLQFASVPEEEKCEKFLLSQSNTQIMGDDSMASNCPTYKGYFDNLTELYKDCKDNDLVDSCTKYKKMKSDVARHCNSLTQYATVGKSLCLDFCLYYKDDIYKIEERFEKTTCGFSERLMNWVINIIKWIKYILPAIVIILGILDFIKAMSSDKDDEMKKTQKRFVIRLIAAALVFIIPLILEFVLIKMGLGYNDCGLFK